MMANAKVWPAMAAAFEKTRGDLAERMLAALEAAQAAGGDIRGKQSAAILIVKAKSSGRPWAGADRVFDLRVEDHPTPIAELQAPHPAAARLRAREPRRRTGVGEEDRRGAEGVHRGRRARARDPRAAVLAGGDAGGGGTRGRGRADLPPRVREGALLGRLVPRLPAAGQLPDDPALIARIVALRAK